MKEIDKIRADKEKIEKQKDEIVRNLEKDLKSLNWEIQNLKVEKVSNLSSNLRPFHTERFRHHHRNV